MSLDRLGVSLLTVFALDDSRKVYLPCFVFCTAADFSEIGQAGHTCKLRRYLISASRVARGQLRNCQVCFDPVPRLVLHVDLLLPLVLLLKLQRLHQALLNYVPLHDWRRLLDEMSEAFPRWLVVVLPLDLQLEDVPLLVLSDSVPSDGFNSIPPPFL